MIKKKKDNVMDKNYEQRLTLNWKATISRCVFLHSSCGQHLKQSKFQIELLIFNQRLIFLKTSYCVLDLASLTHYTLPFSDAMMQKPEELVVLSPPFSISIKLALTNRLITSHSTASQKLQAPLIGRIFLSFLVAWNQQTKPTRWARSCLDSSLLLHPSFWVRWTNKKKGYYCKDRYDGGVIGWFFSSDWFDWVIVQTQFI